MGTIRDLSLGRPSNYSQGFALLELCVVVGIIVLFLSVCGLVFQNFLAEDQGLDSGAQLRMIWRAQKLYLVDQLDSPQSLALPTTLSELTPYLQANDLSVAPTVVVTCLPPLDTRDLTSGTSIKTVANPKSGDSMYDVGPE